MSTVGTRYLDYHNRRQEVLGALQGDPFASKEQVSARMQGLGAGALKTFTEMPLWLLERMAKEEYTPGELRETQRGRVRAEQRRIKEYMDEPPVPAGMEREFQKGAELGEYGMMAAEMVDLPAIGAARVARAMPKLAQMRATDTAKGMLGKLFADEAGVIRAYHGTPHEVDKFRMANIGTGEGAQAYGHGLYFAENPEVAKLYQQNLSPEFVDLVRYAGTNRVKNAASMVAAGVGDSEVIDGLKILDEALTHAEAEDLLIKGKGLVERAKGKLYTVDLDVDTEDLLDWDAPINEQPEKVQKALRQIVRENPDSMLAEMLQPFELGSTRGEAVYFGLSRDLGSPEAASEALRRAGIQGTRYFDAGSRRLGAEQGTRNIAMFGEELIDIAGRE